MLKSLINFSNFNKGKKVNNTEKPNITTTTTESPKSEVEIKISDDMIDYYILCGGKKYLSEFHSQLVLYIDTIDNDKKIAKTHKELIKATIEKIQEALIKKIESMHV